MQVAFISVKLTIKGSTNQYQKVILAQLAVKGAHFLDISLDYHYIINNPILRRFLYSLVVYLYPIFQDDKAQRLSYKGQVVYTLYRHYILQPFPQELERERFYQGRRLQVIQQFLELYGCLREQKDKVKELRSLVTFYRLTIRKLTLF